MGCAGARPAGGVRFQQVQVKGGVVGGKGTALGRGAGRQLVPGREGSAQPPDEFDLYSEGNGKL